jgi:putative transposase
MLKSYKYRIYPTREQQQKIDASIAVCRLVYNLALEVKLRAYREQGINLSSFDLCFQLIDLKREFPWIAEVDSQALQASVKKIEVAFQNFYRGNGFPKFKSKRKGRQSFQCPNNTRRINWEKSTLTIPKIKDIPIKLSRRFEGKIKNITIS